MSESRSGAASAMPASEGLRLVMVPAILWFIPLAGLTVGIGSVAFARAAERRIRTTSGGVATR